MQEHGHDTLVSDSDQFPTDPAGLPEARASEIVELADGDEFELRIAPEHRPGVLRYFGSFGDNERFSIAWHGTGGPIGVSDPISPHRMSKVFVRAAQAWPLALVLPWLAVGPVLGLWMLSPLLHRRPERAYE